MTTSNVNNGIQKEYRIDYEINEYSSFLFDSIRMINLGNYLLIQILQRVEIHLISCWMHPNLGELWNLHLSVELRLITKIDMKTYLKKCFPLITLSSNSHAYPKIRTISEKIYDISLEGVIQLLQTSRKWIEENSAFSFSRERDKNFFYYFKLGIANLMSSDKWEIISVIFKHMLCIVFSTRKL